jgi:hypothetical protein
VIIGTRSVQGTMDFYDTTDRLYRPAVGCGSVFSHRDRTAVVRDALVLLSTQLPGTASVSVQPSYGFQSGSSLPAMESAADLACTDATDHQGYWLLAVGLVGIGVIVIILVKHGVTAA